MNPLGLSKVQAGCQLISKAISKTAKDVSASYQGKDPYFSIDRLKDIFLPKGTKLSHITWKEKGGMAGNYFTTPEVVEISRAKDGLASSKALNQGVQVYSGDGWAEYKKFVQIFEVNEDMPMGGAATGPTKANPQFNPSRYQTHNQYFILDELLLKLKPVSGTLEVMKNTTAPDIAKKLESLRSSKNDCN